MRDEKKVQKLSREIWANICGVSVDDVDDELLEELEENITQDGNTTWHYIEKDYRTLLFSALEKFKKYTQQLTEEIDDRDNLIISIYNKIKKINEFKIDLSEFEIYGTDDLPEELTSADIDDVISNIKEKDE